MEQPRWDRSVDSWTSQVKCPAFGTLELLIKTRGESDPPSEKQLAALALIGNLQKNVRKPIRKSVRRYAKSYFGQEEFEELEPEDLRVEFHTALVPPLKNSESIYFFLQGESDIDIEHGVGCLCKGGDTFRVCHTDEVYASYECDATQAFEMILGQRAVKLDED